MARKRLVVSSDSLFSDDAYRFRRGGLSHASGLLRCAPAKRQIGHDAARRGRLHRVLPYDAFI